MILGENRIKTASTLDTGCIHINISVWASALQKGISWDTPLKPCSGLYLRDISAHKLDLSAEKLTQKRYSKSTPNGLSPLTAIQPTQLD